MQDAPSTDIGQRRFIFVLVPGFTLLSFAGALDALRLANRQLGFDAYHWRILGEGGAEMPCSAGTRVVLDGDLGELRHDDTIVLCGGQNIATNTSQRLINWLRRESRRGVRLVSLCTATHVLARAGLLDGKRATIHWENHDGFAEEFPDVDLAKSIYVIDGKVTTAAGGTAAMDTMLALIASEHGADTANAVADQQIYTTIRTEKDSQRLSVPTRIGVRHPKLAHVISQMEQRIEDPVSPTTLAAEVDLSTRQLERLFRRYLNRSPKRYYMELRLARARNLLMQTDMSVIDVALACGFASPSHFSKCYRAQYGTTPYRERGARAANDAVADT